MKSGSFTSLTPGFIEDSRFSYLCHHIICCNILFWLGHVRKILGLQRLFERLLGIPRGCQTIYLETYSSSRLLICGNVSQFSLVTHSCPTLCDPMNCSKPGLPVHHQLPEFTQTSVHRVSDTMQPSHPLSSPSPPAPQSLPASESFPMSQLFA